MSDITKFNIDNPKLNDAVLNKILTKLEEGTPLYKVFKEHSINMDQSTFLKYVNLTPLLAEAYTRARKVGFDTIIDKTEDEIDEAENRLELDKMRIKTDLRRWAISKRYASKYGDRQQVEITGKDGKDLDFGMKEMLGLLKPEPIVVNPLPKKIGK